MDPTKMMAVWIGTGILDNGLRTRSWTQDDYAVLLAGIGIASAAFFILKLVDWLNP